MEEAPRASDSTELTSVASGLKQTSKPWTPGSPSMWCHDVKLTAEISCHPY